MSSPSFSRAPAVAGRFYAGGAEALHDDVARLIGAPRPGAPALGVMLPHAGYVYSGGVAGQTIAEVAVPRRVIVLGPNHTGRGEAIAVLAAGRFRLPGLEIPIDAELAAAVLTAVPGARDDLGAHAHEHSVEVELPFLAARQPELSFVPVVLGGLGLEATLAVGAGLARAIAAVRAEVLVVASSDMSHYLPDDATRRLDKVALEPLLALDPERLYRTVDEHEISMCGVLPATAMLAAARARGATRARLVAYATSGETSGDTSQTVGYAGVVVS